VNEPGQKKEAGVASTIAFHLISLLLSPISLLGYVIWVGKAVVLGGGKSGVSATAQGPLSARWTEHMFGTRQDEAAYKLMRALPGVPALGLSLVSWPTLLAHRLTGYVPKAFRYPFEGEILPVYEASARQSFFDAVVRKYLGEIKQFVILGAGFDTRAYGLARQAGIRAYEVDAPKTQAVKRATLDKAGVDSSGVRFVAADFEKEDWLKKLVEAGFDTRQPALFLWEGVLIYLDREAVENTLRKIASTAQGSVVAFDYFTTEALESQDLYWRYGRAMTRTAGEAMKFGIDSRPPHRERAAEFVQSCGLSLLDHRTLGPDTEAKRAWGGFAIAGVKA
jgi:methyltransferase (TIGR00027 family)